MDQADPGFLFLSIYKKREAGLDVLPTMEETQTDF